MANTSIQGGYYILQIEGNDNVYDELWNIIGNVDETKNEHKPILVKGDGESYYDCFISVSDIDIVLVGEGCFRVPRNTGKLYQDGMFVRQITEIYRDEIKYTEEGVATLDPTQVSVNVDTETFAKESFTVTTPTVPMYRETAFVLNVRSGNTSFKVYPNDFRPIVVNDNRLMVATWKPHSQTLKCVEVSGSTEAYSTVNTTLFTCTDDSIKGYSNSLSISCTDRYGNHITGIRIGIYSQTEEVMYVTDVFPIAFTNLRGSTLSSLPYIFSIPELPLYIYGATERAVVSSSRIDSGYKVKFSYSVSDLDYHITVEEV